MPVSTSTTTRVIDFKPTRPRYYVGPFTFPFAKSAPISPYSEPGAAGSIFVTDSNNIISVSNGSILISGTAVSNDGPLASDGVRGPGTAVYFSTSSRTTVTNSSNWGLARTNNTSSSVIAGIHYTSSTAFQPVDNTSNTGESITGSAGVHEFLMVARNSGAYIFFRDAGAVGSAWTLVWVTALETTIGNINCKLRLLAGAQNFRLGGMTVFNLTDYLPVFGDDYGFATNRLLTPAATTTYRHEANCWLEFTVTTLPTLGTMDIHFRKQDASNYWIARISTTGDLSLQEVVAGSASQRATAAAVVAAGNRVVVIADSTTIKGYSGAGAAAVRWTYSSASNFATATGGSIGALGTNGVVAELVAYPRTLTVSGL